MAHIQDTPHHGLGFLQTPSQTVGPYFAYGLTPEQYLYDFKQLVNQNMADGEDAIVIKGHVYDGAGNIIPDAIIEIWDPQNQLFGRFGTGTEKDNSFKFTCKKPSIESPFLSLILMMRGQLIHSYTRIYFEDGAELEKDEAYMQVEPHRRHTILAQKKATHYQFDIHMQGQNETVFFDI